MEPARRQEYSQKPGNAEFEEKVVRINRVSKKTKGGNKIGFSALMVVGDRKGRVGVALGKALDTLSAIRKASRRARKKLIKVPMRGTTIFFPIRVKRGAAEVLLKPAPPGTGIIAGGAVRAVVEAAGIHDVVAKILGSSNQASNVYATFEALTRMQRIVQRKGLEKIEIHPGRETQSEGKMKESKREKGSNGKRVSENTDKERQEIRTKSQTQTIKERKR